MIMDQAWQQFLKLQEFWLQLFVIELVKLKNGTTILKIFETSKLLLMVDKVFIKSLDLYYECLK